MSKSEQVGSEKTGKKTDVFMLTVTALMSAVICILGPLSIAIPISPVPISLTIFGIYLAVYVLGMKWGTISCIVYILLGMAGLPVFSGFSGGIAKLAGPTGGYIIGYIFLALICGYFIDRFPAKRAMHVAGMIIGVIVCYAFGTIWLCYQMQIGFIAGLWAGVIPYLPADAVKIALAVMIGPVLRWQLNKIRRR